MRKDIGTKSKREVTYDGSTYKVRSDTIEIPDFTRMERTAVLLWMIRHTYGRGYSNSRPNPLAGFGGAISVVGYLKEGKATL